MRPLSTCALAFALLISSCKESDPRPIVRDHDCPPGASCASIIDRDPNYSSDDVEGARVGLDILWDWDCVFEVSWRVGGDGPPFRATLFLRQGALFPLRGQVVELLDCHGPAYNGTYTQRPLANLLLHAPKEAANTPARESVFVPFDVGWAELDGDRIASAGHMGTAPDDLRAWISSNREEKRDLRVGDSFTWSRSVATIVRIVPPADSRSGWIEVQLSRPPE
jgi:hypothetical protein